MASTAVDLIREKGAALPATALERFQAEQLAVLWEMHAKGCSLSEFAVLLNLAEKYDLDINAHEIWAAKGKGRDGEPGKLMILVGRDGLLRQARRSSDFVTVDGDVHRKNDQFKVTRLPDGTRTVEHSYSGSAEDRGEIVGSWAMVRRTDGSFTNYTYCPLSEYLPSYPGWQKSPWGKQISAMIQKVSVSLCLRIAYGISGVLGEDEVAYQFQDPPAVSLDSLSAVAEDIPADLRDRFYAAYGEAADLRPGQVTPAAVGMTVRGQSEERIREFIESIEAANREAAVAREEVADAEVVPDDFISSCCDAPVRVEGKTTKHYVCEKCGKPCDGKIPPSEAIPAESAVESLRRQLADLEALQVEIEESPGDFAETSAELDRISVEMDRIEAEIEAAESDEQGRLL